MGLKTIKELIQAEEVTRKWVVVGNLRLYLRVVPSWSRRPTHKHSGVERTRCLNVAAFERLDDLDEGEFEDLVGRLERTVLQASGVLYFEAVSKELGEWLKGRGYKHDEESPESWFLRPVPMPKDPPEFRDSALWGKE